MTRMLHGRCFCPGSVAFLLDSPAHSSLSELKILLLFCKAGFGVLSVCCFSRSPGSAHSPWVSLFCLHAWHRPPGHCNPVWLAPGCPCAVRGSIHFGMVLWCPCDHLSFPTSLWACWPSPFTLAPRCLGLSGQQPMLPSKGTVWCSESRVPT